jgi:uncharacterized protein YgbK (DUF1537 family)
VEAVLSQLAAAQEHVLADAVDDADLDVLAAALRRLDRPALVGGAAGLAAALARADAGGVRSSFVPPAAPGAPRLVVSGSCSLRTREQVAAFPGPSVPLRADALLADFDGAVRAVVDAVARSFAAGPSPVLVSSTAAPEALASAPPGAADLLERAAGAVGAAAVRELGVRRLLVAGGETSGAVVRALGLGALRVGPSAGPGLPWLVPAGGEELALLLKSGNFGDVDLFTTAWEVCP